MNNEGYKFTKEKTNICKGIAAILLVMHHLFYLHPELPMIGNIGSGVPYLIAIPCRVCVTIFTILLGYGIEKSVHSKFVNTKDFYKSRVKKFYFNYLFYVFFTLLFMSVTGVLYEKASSGKSFILRLILSLTGTHYLLKNLGINIVWWYVIMLMCCYLSFPFVNRFVLKKPYVLAMISLLVVSLGQIEIKHVGVFEIISWMGVFYLGCFFACENRLEKLDLNGTRINQSKNIVIGDNVWVGQSVIIGKGVRIKDHSIIGIGSVVTKSFDNSNVAIGGNPATIIKRNIDWDIRRL